MLDPFTSRGGQTCVFRADSCPLAAYGARSSESRPWNAPLYRAGTSAFDQIPIVIATCSGFASLFAGLLPLFVAVQDAICASPGSRIVRNRSTGPL